MTTCRRFLLTAVLISLALGQMTRVTLSPGLAFYFHDVLIVLYVLACAPSWRRCWRRRPVSRQAALIILAAASLIVLSWTLNHAWSLIPIAYLARLTAYLLFLFLARLNQDFARHEWPPLLTAYFASLALGGLLQYFFWPDTSSLQFLGWDDHRYRLVGTWLDPAFTGLGLCIGIIYLFTALPCAPRQAKSILKYTLFLCLLALILTYSRASFVSLAGVTVAYVVKMYSRIKKLQITKYSLIIAVFMIASLAFFSLTARWIPSDSTNLLRTNSLVARAEMFTRQVSSFTWWQWLIGRGVFVPLPGQRDPGQLRAVGYKQTASFPDNSFLLLVSFFGLPLTLVIVYYSIHLLCHLWRASPSLFYVILSIIIHSQFDQALFQPFVLLTAGLVVAEIVEIDKDKNFIYTQT